VYVGQDAAGGRQRVPDLLHVGFEAGVDAAQVAEQLAGQLQAVGGGRGHRTHAAQQRGRLVGRQVGRGAAGEQVTQQGV
jgi:hypothetical protein